MAVIDKAGNVFDATPSGGWVPGAVILGDTGIGMSVRGEQFWLDKTRANQIRPRARPRYTLTPSLVFKDGQPLMALGTPGGDNQDQTILQAFLNIVEFWDRLVPERPQRARVAALPDAALPRLLLAARRRLQQAEPRGDDSRRRLQRAQGARPRREPHPRLRDVGLRHHGDDRSGDQEPPRRCRPAARLLRGGVLGGDYGRSFRSLDAAVLKTRLGRCRSRRRRSGPAARSCRVPAPSALQRVLPIAAMSG